MIDRLKQLVRHSAVYSINSITEKALGVILIPLMTGYFSKLEFGNWDLLDNTINIMADVLLLGLATVIIFFNNPKEYPYEKKSSFFTLALFLSFVAVLFVLIVEAIIYFNLLPMNVHSSVLDILRIASYIIGFRILSNFILGKLRSEERSVHYTIVYSIKLFIRTILIIYFILFTDLKWPGVFYASLIAEVIIFIILLPVLIKNISFILNLPALKVSLKIGGALVLSTIGFNILNLSDRYIIKYLIGGDYVGLYGLGYRVAGILNMFIILPFTLTLLPATYKVYKQRDDKRYFSKLMTYSSFFFVWGFIAISLFSKEIVRIIGQKEDFWSAYMVVPLILLGYVFSGMRLTAALGMMLTKNTKHIGITTLISAAINVILNFILIPYYGIMAAAFNTLIAYIIFYFLTLRKSNEYYKIPYENRKLFLLITVGVVLSSVIYYFPNVSLLPAILIKLALIISFPFIIYFFNFYEKAELDILLNRKKLLAFAVGIFKKNNDVEKTDDLTIK
jgi:O-antigen/teichoic acid export membrane protein